MKESVKIALVDAGNTAVKLAFVADGVFQNETRIEKSNTDTIRETIKKNNVDIIIISSVLTSEETKLFYDLGSRVDVIDVHSNIFFPIQYGTPKTLGMDRICNAAYAYTHVRTEYAVILDIGTCIKFDLVERELGYLGGSISPGINLRYKALNSFTSKLPLIDNKTSVSLVGNSTENSIRSGVINGIQAEIEGVMQRYIDKYENLTFFVTGGDHKHFDIRLKNNIFADEFLTLKGLYEIYKRQA